MPVSIMPTSTPRSPCCLRVRAVGGGVDHRHVPLEAGERIGRHAPCRCPRLEAWPRSPAELLDLVLRGPLERRLDADRCVAARAGECGLLHHVGQERRVERPHGRHAHVGVLVHDRAARDADGDSCRGRRDIAAVQTTYVFGCACARAASAPPGISAAARLQPRARRRGLAHEDLSLSRRFTPRPSARDASAPESRTLAAACRALPPVRRSSASSASAIASGRRRAAGDAEVDREERLDRPDELVGGAEQVAAERAVAERRDAARLGHRVVGDEQRLAHAGRDGAGDEQHVGVARRGDDAEAEALEVVVGARGEGELVLAAVARAGVDVADGEAAAAVGAREAMSRRRRRRSRSRVSISGRRRRSRARSSC